MSLSYCVLSSYNEKVKEWFDSPHPPPPVHMKWLTLSYTGFFMLVLHGGGGGALKVPAAFFSETVKATTIKLGTLTN